MGGSRMRSAKFATLEFQSPEVVEVEDTFDLTGGGGHDEGGDLAFFHAGERLGGEGFGVDSEGSRVHDLRGGMGEGVGAVTLKETAEVAVGDHAAELTVLEDGGHAELLMRHFVDDLRHGGSGSYGGQGVAKVHEIADTGEATAEAAPGVEVGEMLWGEVAAVAEGEGEGVAERKHDGGGGGGGEVEGTGLGVYRGVQDDGAGLREGGGGAGAEGHEGDLHALESGEEAEEFFGLAAVGEGDEDVMGGEHAEVAVDGFGGMEEVRRGAGGTEGGGDLAGDDAGFAHTGEENGARVGGQDAVHGALEGGQERGFQTVGEGGEGSGFESDEAGGVRCRIERCWIPFGRHEAGPSRC